MSKFLKPVIYMFEVVRFKCIVNTIIEYYYIKQNKYLMLSL